MDKKSLSLSACIFAATMATGASAFAAPLVTLNDGSFGERVFAPNDDGSRGPLNIGFDVNFFGQQYNQFFVNNNGNITFNGPVRNFTPRPFPVANQPMIAPFWADVDTRNAPAGYDSNVYVAAPNATTRIVTWNNTGYYNQNFDKVNNFQLILTDKSAETGSAGDFDIEFRYDQLQWTTGDASGGRNGAGGTPAQAGFDAGDRQNFFVLPGSRTASVLELANNTNVDGGEAGQWVFAIRNGSTPGETPENPILPVVIDGDFTFEFGVEEGEIVFIDPEVAIGYDYVVTDSNSPSITHVTAPEGFGDDLYNLCLRDTSGEFSCDTIIRGGEEYAFANAVREFRLMGIEMDAQVDPANPRAFVTGLRFNGSGTVGMTQSPITANYNPVGVNEPATIGLFAAGLGLLGLRRRRSA